MIQHLENIDSSAPRTQIEVTNPGYISPEQLAFYRSLEKENRLWTFYYETSVDDIIADAKIVWGDPFKPTIMMDVYANAYCGELLIREAKPAPQILYDAINYTNACNLLDYHEEDICFDCVGHLDRIRDKQGYRPVLEYLRDPDSCCCASWILQRNGCQCWVGKIKK